MDGNAECFTDEELLILQDGIHALVEKAEKATALVKNKEVHRILSDDIWKYSSLDVKLCSMMGKI